MVYNLEDNGDRIEMLSWKKFLKNEFGSYEVFWQKYIIPLTNRPRNIHFKSNVELSEVGKTENDICIAQLHYSILRHLARCYEIKTSRLLNLDLLTEGIVRLVGCQDIAFELLERVRNPNKYSPWSEDEGRKARSAWQ